MTPTPAIDLDSLMTSAQFAAWMAVDERWVQKRRRTLPGVVIESRKVWRIHPRTYLAKRLKAKI